MNIDNTVAELVSERPGRSRVFEGLGIDYCCGGRRPLREACAEIGVDPESVLRSLSEADREGAAADEPDCSAMTMTELADHIEQTHHVYLKRELPRISDLTAKVVEAHRDKEVRLREVAQVFAALSAELQAHMMKEERILFPLIRQLDGAGGGNMSFHCGSVANPISVMEFEHDSAGSALVRLRSLTDGFTAPDYACNTWRALCDALEVFERDLHLHIHKENNILFPRAIEAERAASRRLPADS